MGTVDQSIDFDENLAGLLFRRPQNKNTDSSDPKATGWKKHFEIINDFFKPSLSKFNYSKAGVISEDFKPDSGIEFFKGMRKLGVTVPENEVANIDGFIRGHREIIPEITKVVHQLHKDLKGYAVKYEILLEMFYYPESDDEYMQIILRCSDYPEKLINYIESFNKKYFKDKADLLSYIFVTTDYQDFKE